MIYSQQLSNTAVLLTIVTMLYIVSPVRIYLIFASFYLLTRDKVYFKMSKTLNIVTS